MFTAIFGAFESGIIYAIMALGVYLSFRVLDFPDLTVDGSFVTGAAVAATMIVSGANPFLLQSLHYSQVLLPAALRVLFILSERLMLCYQES